jgi:putative transposase
MPRIARVAPGGIVQHVLNRGNNRQRLFRKRADYAAFAVLLAEACGRFPGVRLLAWCLMPTHFHLVVWPRREGEVTAFMRWLANAHVRRHHTHYGTGGTGHLYQGRFKNFPVQHDEHVPLLLRYVEANARRAGLVRRAEAWEWGSLWDRARGAKRTRRAHDDDDAGQRPPLTDPPGGLPARASEWVAAVNAPLPPQELERVRLSVVRGRPLGSDAWVRRTVDRLGLESTVRPRGRPRKHPVPPPTKAKKVKKVAGKRGGTVSAKPRRRA